MNRLIQLMAQAQTGPFEPVFASTSLTASDSATGTGFGTTVATNFDGTTVATGAPTDSRIASNAGAVYVHVRNASKAWSQQVKLTSSTASQRLGTSLALSDDGNTLVAGTNDGNNVLVYKRTGTSWGAPTTINPSASGGSWGSTVSINAAGTRIAVGAPGQTFNGNANAGVIYVYDLISGVWTETVTALGRTGAAASEGVGAEILISADGQYILAKPSQAGTRKGIIFFLSGGVWAQQSILTATTGANTDISLSRDGSVAMVSDAATTQHGYIFTRNGVNWALITSIAVPSTFPGGAQTAGSMGASAMSSDGGLYLTTFIYQQAPVVFEPATALFRNTGGFNYQVTVGAGGLPTTQPTGFYLSWPGNGFPTSDQIVFSGDGKSAFSGQHSGLTNIGTTQTAQSGDRV